MDRARWLHLRALVATCFAFLLVAGAAGAVSVRLDLDQDGLDGQGERAHGTSARDADTDDDGLPDGWEVRNGLSATAVDADRDGLDDDAEVRHGSDPLVSDTDNDGLADLAENPDGEGGPDCDGDGATAARETDDDADGRPDAQEPADQRCDADMDDDNVLDGHERNAACVALADCDSDGVNDWDEPLAGFDPLDPDTYDVHLPDGIGYAFARSGQPPSADADLDGIPDAWENQTGLIDWGPFVPRAGQRDLFAEFVRVLGPDSGRYSDISLAGAYEKVASQFRENGLQFQYVETVVRLDTEPVAAMKPSSTTTHYRTVLEGAKYSANPYVLTIVLNPQHDQSQILHAGVAPLRGMLAAVDVGQFVDFYYHSSDGNFTGIGPLTPFMESVIAGGRVAMSSQAGINSDGTYFTYTSGGIEVRWTPRWFKAPQIRHPAGHFVPMVLDRIVLEDEELAHTLLHEIGHTLGLCHTHEPDCKALLPLADQPRDAESSMSYSSPDALIAYLPGEWERVRAYLACPPPTPIRLVAEGATPDARLDAKYAYELDPDPATAGRNCEDYAPLEHAFDPVLDPFRYEAPVGRSEPPAPDASSTPTVAYWSGAAALGAFSALSVARLPPLRRQFL